jgi:hypothetical protein
MTTARECGDVLRVARPFGLRTRNMCGVCGRFLSEGPQPTCRFCGTVYQAFAEGGDYQVVRLGPG